MNAKEKKIIEESMKLFAKKGYSTTSIQEIVDACGMSKGAFYLHFKSKDALLLEAFKYQFTMIKSKIDALPIEQYHPKEAFVLQLKTQFEEIKKHKDFIIMQIREQTTPINGEVEEFMRNMGLEIGTLYHHSLSKLYGEAIAPYLFDLNVILQGIIHSYLKFIIFEQATFDLETLSYYIVNRIDDLAKGYQESTDEPILAADWVTRQKETPQPNSREDILELVSKAIKIVKDEELFITLEVIEEELKKNEPRLPVIQGMVGNIKADSPLHPLKKVIQEYIEEKKGDRSGF
ncbi:TetR/AcrR family transcriptional regulator [Bacillus weihaiensis]|uniref:TetR/AcrR family transcriptional regulator n=1 Tax=Bacillus weihaiensis TaxID=1547283 RepID=UPI00235512B9|nr:TetR/AcrR family transcriptional regulator [Bacillus weihaiensis]